MDAQEFVRELRISAIDMGLDITKKLFCTTAPAQATDPHWQRALGLFGDLSSAQRVVFFEVLRQVAVDTTSAILGTIEGVSALGEGDQTFSLLCDGRDLGHDLQTLFLNDEEHHHRSVGAGERGDPCGNRL